MRSSIPLFGKFYNRTYSFLKKSLAARYTVRKKLRIIIVQSGCDHAAANGFRANADEASSLSEGQREIRNANQLRTYRIFGHPF